MNKIENELLNESKKINIDDKCQIIKNRYIEYIGEKNRNYKINLSILFKSLSISFVLILLLAIIIPNINKGQKNRVVPITSNISETYSFQLMSAANIILANNSQVLAKVTNNSVDYTEIAKSLNSHFLTFKELLSNEKMEYESLPSSIPGYSEQLKIMINYNGISYIEYNVYYNKTLTEEDEDEKEYNIRGIMVIDGSSYDVIGESEHEDDETSTSLKVIISPSTYFIIEQEYEDDEEEFVYSYYVNNKLLNHYKFQKEIENGKTEIELEYIEGKIKGKIKALLKNNSIEFNVKTDDYNGRINAKIEDNYISYYFVKANKTVNLNLF